MKLLAAISHHGLGHLAQAGPVLAQLHALSPDLDLTVWSALGTEALQSRLPFSFCHRREAADVGLPMVDAVTVDKQVSLSVYLDFHDQWDRRVAGEADWLREQGFQAVFSDVAYLPLAAASQAAIPAVALCSLNWRDIASAYLGDESAMASVLTQMETAYLAATDFLRPAPSMPMEWLPQRRAISPIAARGTNRRAELAGMPGVHARDKWVLVGFGGIGYVRSLPRLPGITWLAPDGWANDRADVIPLRCIGLPFIDLVASCDALLTKVGYGSFVEAVAHGVPVLYIDRPDWPETPFLARWLDEHGNGLPVVEAEAFSPRAGEYLERLWKKPPKPVPQTNGATEAALFLRRLMTG